MVNHVSLLQVTDELVIGVSKDALRLCSGPREREEIKSLHSLPRDIFYALKSALQDVCPTTPLLIWKPSLLLESSLDSSRIYFLEPFPAFADKLFFVSAFYEVLLDFMNDQSKLRFLSLDKQITQLSSLYELDYIKFVKAAKYIYAYPLALLMKKSHSKVLSTTPIQSRTLVSSYTFNQMSRTTQKLEKFRTPLEIGEYVDRNFSRYMITELPPKPDFLKLPGPQLGGPLRRFYRNRMVGPKSYQFGFSILQGVKRGCKAVSETLFASTFAKHVLDAVHGNVVRGRAKLLHAGHMRERGPWAEIGNLLWPLKG